MVTAIQFVDSIAASPTVRLDINADEWMVRYDGLDLSPPPLKTAIASTLLQDGDQIPASAYANRDLILPLEVTAASEDLAAAELQALNRELNRATNILKYQVDTTNPVFFRTFRSPDYRWEHTSQGASVFYRTEIRLRAEPFAYGTLETPVSGVTVNANPAAGSNGCFVDVTGVKGDVESPALIRWPESAVSETRESLFAVRRRGTPSSAPFVFQVEAMTQGTDTTVQANDTAFSGAGSNYSRCTFATNQTLALRASFSDLGTASVDLRGKYQVFLRYRKNTSTDDINIVLEWGDADVDDVITNDAFTAPDTTSICMAYLGEISIPYGADPVHDFRSGVELVVDDGFWMGLRAERTAGSGTLDLDCILLVPADDRMALIEWGDTNSAADRRWLDALDWSVHARTSADEVVSTEAPPTRAGGLPLLTPNQTNRIYMLYEVASGRAHAIATTTVVSVSYYPLYLTVRPAST